MKWDRNDWQGKSEEQVRYSYYAIAIAGVFLMIAGLAIFISKI
jgi:uncharacterized membrane protein